MGFATDILKTTDSVIVGYTSGAWSALVSSNLTAIQLALVLYVAIYGWCVMSNWIEVSTSDAWKHLFKMMAVFTVATSWGYFHVLVYDLFVNGPDSLIAALTNGDTSKTGLDKVFETGFKSANKIFQTSNWFDIAQLTIAAFIILITTIAVGYALFLLILAKFALAIILAIGALFVMMYLFNATKGLFASWVNACLNYALIPVLAYGVLHLILKIFKVYTDKLAAATASGPITFDDVPGFFLFGFVCIAILWQVPAMAAGLAGGLSLSTGGVPAIVGAGGILGLRYGRRRAYQLGRWAGGRIRSWYRSGRGAASTRPSQSKP
jgi:type IV secretion system protein VirB6